MSATTPFKPLINTPFIIQHVYLAYCDTTTSGDIIYSPFHEKNRTHRVIRTGNAVRCLVFTSIKDFSIYYSQTPIMTPVLRLIPLHSIKDTHSIPHLSLFIITIFNTLCYLSGLPRNRKSVLQNREIPCIPIPALE